MKAPPPPWMVSAFPAFFVAQWTLISFIISKAGGWSALATTYPATSKPAGQKFRSLSAQIGGSGYNSCLSGIVSSEGLYLQTWLAFRLFHPPLLIPYAAFTEIQTRKLLWSTSYQVNLPVKNGRTVRVRFYSQKLLKAMQEKSDGQSEQLAKSPWSG